MGFQEDGVDVAFQVIDADQRLAQRLRQHFSISDAHEQRSY